MQRKNVKTMGIVTLDHKFKNKQINLMERWKRKLRIISLKRILFLRPCNLIKCFIKADEFV